MVLCPAENTRFVLYREVPELLTSIRCWNEQILVETKAGFATVVVLMFLLIQAFVGGKERLKCGKPPQLIVSIYHSWAGPTWFSVEASF